MGRLSGNTGSQLETIAITSAQEELWGLVAKLKKT
jgi:hypothetical protein